MRVEVWAYIVFAALTVVLFFKSSQASRHYGEVLTKLREECEDIATRMAQGQEIEDIVPESVDGNLFHIAVLRDGGLLAHTGEPCNASDIIRIGATLKPRTIGFEHLPDAKGLAHVVAFFAIDVPSRGCICIVYSNVK